MVQIPFVSVVIAAAGSSTRMRGIDKQKANLSNLPVIIRTIRQFEQNANIDEIILVCRQDDIESYQNLLRRFGMGKIAQIVRGGETRQQSVFQGVAHCSPLAQYLAIHDGARPLVTQQVIHQALEGAIRHGAAAPGVPAGETIKIISDESFVDRTPSRSSLRVIQTPQIFNAQLYRQAMELALAQGKEYTDDCQLLEAAGHKVFITQGDRANIKITTPLDMALSEFIIQSMEQVVV